MAYCAQSPNLEVELKVTCKAGGAFSLFFLFLSNIYDVWEAMQIGHRNGRH